MILGSPVNWDAKPTVPNPLPNGSDITLFESEHLEAYYINMLTHFESQIIPSTALPCCSVVWQTQPTPSSTPRQARAQMPHPSLPTFAPSFHHLANGLCFSSSALPRVWTPSLARPCSLLSAPSNETSTLRLRRSLGRSLLIRQHLLRSF